MNFKSKPTVLFIAFLSVIFFRCDEADELTELRITEDFSETINVNLSDDSMGQPQSVSFNEEIDITESEEIENYVNLIQDVDINSLTYEINNYTGVENGTITEASISFNGESINISDINLEVSDDNNIVYEIEDTSLLTSIGEALKETTSVSIGLTGTVSETPVEFDVIITLDTTVTVDLL